MNDRMERELQNTLALMERRLPRAQRKKAPRRMLALALAVVLVLGLAVGAGATGVFNSIFARYAGKSGNELPPGINDTVISRAEPVEETEASVDDASPLSFQVTEASCDGRTLSMAVAIYCADDALNQTDTIFQPSTEGGKVYSIEINGKEAGGGFAGWPEFTRSEESGLYTGILSMVMPDAMGLENRETLDVTVRFPYMRVLQFPKGYLAGTTQETRTYEQCTYSEIRTGWTASFTLDVDNSYRTYEPNAEFGGVVLEKVILSEGGLECTFTIPEDMDTNAVLNPMDDTGEADYTSRTQGGNWWKDGKKNFTMFLSAPAHETHTLTFRVVDWPEEPGNYYATGEVDNFPVLGTYTLNLD